MQHVLVGEGDEFDDAFAEAGAEIDNKVAGPCSWACRWAILPARLNGPDDLFSCEYRR